MIQSYAPARGDYICILFTALYRTWLLGRNPESKHTIFSLSMENEQRLTQGGTAEPVSRDQTLRRERGQTGKYLFSLFS